MQPLGDRAGERVFDERTLAGTGNTGDARERAERNPQIDVAEVVLPRTEQFQPPAAGRRRLAVSALNWIWRWR